MELKELKEIIQKDKMKKEGRYYARQYYNYKPNRYFPDTNLTEDYSYADKTGKIVTVERDKKTFMYTNYAKLLINQKVDYILAQTPTFQKIKTYENFEIADMLEDMTLTASLDIKAWLFIYLQDNIVKWILVPDRQLIPYYDEYNNLNQMIRYYEEQGANNVVITNVEIWTLSGVSKFSYKDNDINITNRIECNHYEQVKKLNNEIIEKVGMNFEFIPFIDMNNNKNMENDIDMIKDLLDFYNIIKSGYIDNILKFQEALMKLTGYSGNDDFLKQTNEQMRKYKIIALGDTDSNAEYMSVEIPVEARKVMIEELKENIFKIGQGVNPDKIGDGNITNIVIKNRYSALNMKADKTAKQVQLFYKKFIDILNKIYNTSYNSEIDFNKSINWNDSETIDNCVKSVGIISNETIIANHPFVEDLTKELKQIEEDREKDITNYNNFNQNNVE